jgi:hypothetical protein
MLQPLRGAPTITFNSYGVHINKLIYFYSVCVCDKYDSIQNACRIYDLKPVHCDAKILFFINYI